MSQLFLCGNARRNRKVDSYIFIIYINHTVLVLGVNFRRRNGKILRRRGTKKRRRFIFNEIGNARFPHHQSLIHKNDSTNVGSRATVKRSHKTKILNSLRQNKSGNMFSALSVGGSGFRLASQSMLRSSKSLLSTPCLQQKQKMTTAIVRGKFSSPSRTNNKKFFSTSGKESAKSAETKESVGWWRSPEFWGLAGSIAAWGMSGSAIYDAAVQGPEVISLTMTPVLMVYSGVFARWAWVVKPRNLSLMWCHIANVTAQTNQLRRALEHKMNNGEEEQVKEMAQQVGVLGAATAAAIVAGPRVRTALTTANLGIITSIAAADAGPFTVHFWCVPRSRICHLCRCR